MSCSCEKHFEVRKYEPGWTHGIYSLTFICLHSSTISKVGFTCAIWHLYRKFLQKNCYFFNELSYCYQPQITDNQDYSPTSISYLQDTFLKIIAFLASTTCEKNIFFRKQVWENWFSSLWQKFYQAKNFILFSLT